MFALLLKIIPAIVVFIVTMGIIDTERLQGHPLFKGIIALLTAVSTLLLTDQLYSLATGEKSLVSQIAKEWRGEGNSSVQTVSSTKWNPKIYQGKRSYSKNSTHTVKDNYTGLIWQKEDDGEERTWAEAVSYCNDLSLGGRSWRLPKQEELYYLGDVTKYNPAVDKEFFNLKSSYYWSNTPYKNDSDSAWLVDFRNGNDLWDGKTRTGYVLCVSGQ